MKPIIAAAVLALLGATAAAAQDGATAPAAGAVTLVQAGRLLDHPGHDPRGPSTIVIRDGKVEAVRDGGGRTRAGLPRRPDRRGG